MGKKKLVLFILVIVISTFMISCGNSEKEAKQNPESGKTVDGLTSFTTQDIYGAVVTEDTFKDYDLTMVNVWGTFCNPCLEEMPYLGELQKELEPKGINIIGIVVDVQDKNFEVIDSQQDLAREIAEKTGADYQHLLMTQDLVDAKIGEFDAIPASFFVDSKGNIVGESYIGSKSKTEWTEIINDTLESVQK